MNISVYMRISKALFIVLLLLASSCQPATAPESEPAPDDMVQPEASAQPEEPGEIMPDTLRVRVIQYDIGASDDQLALIQGAADRIGAEMGLSIEVEPVILAANPDSCNAAAIMYFDDADIFMQDSVCASHAFASNSYARVPDDLAGTMDFFGAGQSAFSDPDGNLWAAPFGTSPMMLIYNPEILGELSVEPSLSEVMEMMDANPDHPLTIPPHGAIAVAMVQSYQTDPFNELSLLNADLYATLNGLADIIDPLAGNGQIRSAGTQEILSGFVEGNIAWTVHDLMFLRMLKMNGYEGPLAAASLPQINRFGGSAMGIAWVLPGDLENQDLAWQVVSEFAADPLVIEWLVSNGFVPFYDLGYQVFDTQRGEIGAAWLPADLWENDRNFGILRNLANVSPAWSLPASVPIDLYNENILPLSTELITGIANGESPMMESLDNWEIFLESVDILR